MTSQKGLDPFDSKRLERCEPSTYTHSRANVHPEATSGETSMAQGHDPVESVSSAWYFAEPWLSLLLPVDL
jgi:hypothetical protein